jgi:hypothetical protein
MSLTAVTPTSAEPDCRVGGPMHVLILHEHECAFMCLWHLTTYFEALPDAGEIQWHSCSPSDLKAPESSARAEEHARESDVIVFCRSGAGDFSPDVKEWIERWLPAKSGQAAALGLLLVCGNNEANRAGAYLHGVAERGGMTFLGVGHCAYEKSHGTAGPPA